MPKEMENIGSRTASGMVWLAGQTVFSRIIGLISQWVLANWLLNQQDFGLIALVYTITTIAGQVVDPGINAVLLQRQRYLRRWVTPAFWMSLSAALCGALVMIAAGAIVVHIANLRGNISYGNPDLFKMITILALAAPITALGMVPWVNLQSQMRFARIASFNASELLLQQSLLIAFAWMGFGAFSFVLPAPITATIKTITLWIVAPIRIQPQLSLHRWPALTTSTGWVFGQRIINTATSVGDYMAIGVIVANNVLLGQYYFAFNLSTQVIRALCDNTTAVLMPALTAMFPDRPRMFSAATRASRALAATVIPVTTLQILLAGPAIRLIYVAKWESAIILVQILSVGPMLLAPAWAIGSMVNASGRFRAGFFSWLFNGIMFFGLVIPLSWRWSTVGTAIGVSIWSWLMGMSFAVAALGSLRGIMLVVQSGIRPMIAAVVAAAPSALIVWLVPQGRIFAAITIIVVTALTSTIYLAMLRQLDRDTMNVLIERFGGMLRPITRLIFRRPVPAT